MKICINFLAIFEMTFSMTFFVLVHRKKILLRIRAIYGERIKGEAGEQMFSIHLYNTFIIPFIYGHFHGQRLVSFCRVGFYGISTIVGYLMPKPLYTYVLDIYI